MWKTAALRCKPVCERTVLARYSLAFNRSKTSWQSPAAAASAETVADHAAAAEVTGVPEGRSSGPFRALKALLGLSTLAIAGGASYVTYAHSTPEIEDFVKSYRQQVAAAPPVAQNEDLVEKVKSAFYAASLQVALKAADAYLDTRKYLEDHVKGYAQPSSEKLLPDLVPQEQHVYTLVLDLNDTLVFSDWKRERGWGTFKRPGVDAFLEKMATYYEIVIYSDQLNFYIDPILERLDPKGYIRYRLARDATHYVDGKHYRDLSKLNRDPKKVMYISGHALESCLQPENAVPVKPWKLEENDTALLDLIPFLEFVARQSPPDVRNVLASYQGRDIASEFRERAKQNQRRVQERKQQSKFWRS